MNAPEPIPTPVAATSTPVPMAGHGSDPGAVKADGKLAYDPLESLLRRGEMLDIELDDIEEGSDPSGVGTQPPTIFSVGANVGKDTAKRSNDTVGISTGALHTSPKPRGSGDADLTVRQMPKLSGSSTAMDGGKLADNLALGSSARYRLRKELGAGGMATVYDAVDLDLRRHVAIKVLHDEHRKKAERGDDSEDRSALQRFVEEAQITGQLEHPNIVPVHEIGRDEAGRIYFTMKRVEGSSLAEILGRMRDGDKETLDRYGVFELCEIFVKVCDAIGFAHSRKVIHRDLKPDNIMVGRFGEVQVMDWGLAKVKGTPGTTGGGRSTETFTGMVSTEAGAAQQTIEGTISGTPAYMPPEQARGEINRIDERSDVFMLGGILYELITLVPPYHAESSLSALLRAQKHDLAEPKRAVEDMAVTMKLPDGSPVTPAGVSRARKFPAELAAIAMKALRESPADRYQRPQDMARDVERYLKREPVTVFTYPAHVKIAKWIDKNRVKSSIAAAVFLMSLITLTLVSLLLKSQAEEETQKREQLLALEESARKAASREQAREREDRVRLEVAHEKSQRRATANQFLNLGGDMLKRLADMRDPTIAHDSRLEALRQFTKATEADPDFSRAWQSRADVLLDLGRIDSALVDIEKAKQAALDENLNPSPASLMSGGMALLTKGVLRLENDEIWNSKFREYMRLVREVAGEDSDYWQLADILERATETLKGRESMITGREAMLKLGTRMEQLVRPNQQLWEVYLFAAWFASSGWMEPKHEGSNRNDFAMSLVDRALELRRNLPLAVMFKTQLQAQIEVVKLIASNDPKFRGREGASRLNRDAVQSAMPSMMEVLDKYVRDFPMDPMGYYMRGSVTARLGLASSDPNRAARYADLEKAIELADNPAPARTAMALLLESEGRHAEAADSVGTTFAELLARKDFVTGNWSPGIGGFSPSILFVRCLIQSGRAEEARIALQAVRDNTVSNPLVYSEHFIEAMRVWVIYGKREGMVAFIEAVAPVEPNVRELMMAARYLQRIGLAEESARYIESARKAAEQEDSTVRQELAELRKSNESQLELLQTIPSGGVEASMFRGWTLPQWRAIAVRNPGDLMTVSTRNDELHRAILRSAEEARPDELRNATMYWARRLSAPEGLEPAVLSDHELMVLGAYKHLERMSPRDARAACDNCVELRALVDKVREPAMPSGS